MIGAASVTVSPVHPYLCISLAQHLHEGEGALKTLLLRIKKREGLTAVNWLFPPLSPFPDFSLHAEPFEFCYYCLCCFSLLVIATMEFDLIAFARG